MIHNKAALRRFGVKTVFMYWHTNQLREQRFGKTADFWMPRYYGSKRATIATDSIRSIGFFQFCQSAKFIENGDSGLQACLQVARRNIPLPGDAVSCHTQKGFHLLRRHLRTQDFQELAHYRPIRLGKQCFGMRREVVDIGRFAITASYAALSYQPIAFKRSEVRTHSIISESKCLGKFLNRVALTAKQ